MMKKSFLIIAVTLLLLCLFSSAAAASSVDARITYFNPASGTYYPGDSVTSSLSFKNTGTYTWTYWVSYSVQDENGKWYDTPLEPVRVSRRRTTTVTNTWTVPDDALAGEYSIVMNIYKRNGTTKLTSAEKNRAFTIINELEDTPIEDTPVEFSFIDNFDSFNSNNWMKSSFILGRSTLDPANVDVNNGNLRIKLPANTLNGGEIQSVDLYKYGTYSARMKLPNAPSSITGFFMYLGPDFYNEIDIVVYNDNSGNVAFTTYANGKMQHSVTKNMGFDPTDDYHDYKFEFEQGVLNFYVDDKLLQTWTDGMTTNSMHLMVHTLYPQWLEGTKQTSNQYLLVDWIKLDDTPVDDTPVDDTPVDDT
ncbi:family 16 glycosylhydrolase, partial [Methanolobus sp.]|uniref:family 16 glycosylhydrolase n=1 Tax=Methanolobus sp. TaxID=1874737 RepID=UPI0025DE4B37